ncbi:hypothetical protein ACTVZO_44125 [Streptomyces sp. IBSNAI002]|uniref:hypothetical protein n=1 Tax=Streptomyces sp. IBSNAI002 TaxID=3457500 RepID=UPI003FD12051
MSTALAAGSLTMAVSPIAMAEAPAAENSITPLGSGNRFATWDSELRFDGILNVPKDRSINKAAGIKYSHYGNGTLNYTAYEKEPTALGVGEEYMIVDTKTVGDRKQITFHLRGDLNVDANACPDPSKKYQIKIQVPLDNGDKVEISPEVDVVNGDRCGGDPAGTSKPFVRLPYDTHWGGAAPGYSQGGFGYIAADGQIPGDKFIIDLVNRRIGSQAACNASDHVYYQIVDAQGRPSKKTPEPVRQAVKGHAGSGTGDRFVLPAMDLSGEDPGYYKFLVWPQAGDGSGGNNQACSYDRTDKAQAFQVGSTFVKYGEIQHGPAAPVIQTPVNDSTTGLVPKFSGTAAGATLVRVYEDGKEIGNRSVGTDGYWAWGLNDWTVPPKLRYGKGEWEPGRHTVEIVAEDADGNASEKSTVSFTVA